MICVRSVSCCTGSKWKYCPIALLDTLPATEHTASANLAVLSAAAELVAVKSKKRDGTEMAATNVTVPCTTIMEVLDEWDTMSVDLDQDLMEGR